VRELVAKIDHYVQNSNPHAQPFVWTARAESISPKSRDYFTGQHTNGDLPRRRIDSETRLPIT